MAQHISLPFTATRFGEGTWPHLEVAQERLTGRLDLTTGAIDVGPGGLPNAIPIAREEGLHPRVRARIEETPKGPTTILSAAGWSLTISGELYDASHHGELIVMLLAHPAYPSRRLSAVAVLRGQREVLRLPAGHRGHLVGPLAVCRDLGCVHYFEAAAGTVRAISLPAPEAWALDARLGAGHIAILGRQVVLDVELASLAATGPHTAVPIRSSPLSCPGRAEAEPALVLFTFSGRMLVEHPTRGRLTVPRTADSPPVEKGDHLILEDVREELPGVVKVHAWRRADDRSSQRPTEAVLELDAPSVAPLAEGEPRAVPLEPSPRPGAEHLEKLAAEHGFLAPPLLLRVLREAASDPVFGRWMDRCGFASFEVRGLTEDWDDADPCLLAFAGRGTGDEFALYLYPPACGPVVEPPVVEFLHETGYAEFMAQDFAAFFEAMLREAWVEPEVIRSVRERLDFPSRGRPVGREPAYLPAPGRTFDDEERRAVSRMIEDGDAARLDGVDKDLLQLYLDRNWTYPTSTLGAALV